MTSSVTLSITYWASRSLRESSSGEENTLSASSPESTAKESRPQPVNTSLQAEMSCLALLKRLTLTRAIHLQSITWANELFSLMQNMSQTFWPQSGAASRHLPHCARRVPSFLHPSKIFRNHFPPTS